MLDDGNVSRVVQAEGSGEEPRLESAGVEGRADKKCRREPRFAFPERQTDTLSSGAAIITETSDFSRWKKAASRVFPDSWVLTDWGEGCKFHCQTAPRIASAHRRRLACARMRFAEMQ